MTEVRGRWTASYLSSGVRYRLLKMPLRSPWSFFFKLSNILAEQEHHLSPVLSLWTIKQSFRKGYFTWKKKSNCKVNTQALNQLAQSSFLCPLTVKQSISGNAVVMDLVDDVPFQSRLKQKEVICHHHRACWTTDVVSEHIYKSKALQLRDLWGTRNIIITWSCET